MKISQLTIGISALRGPLLAGVPAFTVATEGQEFVWETNLSGEFIQSVVFDGTTYTTDHAGTALSTYTVADLVSLGGIALTKPTFSYTTLTEGDTVDLVYPVFLSTEPYPGDPTPEMFLDAVSIGAIDTRVLLADDLDKDMTATVTFNGVSVTSDALVIPPAVIPWVPTDLPTAALGAWYDLKDPTNMFTDAAGTTAVQSGVSGQIVRRINDKSGRGQHVTNASSDNVWDEVKEQLTLSGTSNGTYTSIINYTQTGNAIMYFGLKTADTDFMLLSETTATAPYAFYATASTSTFISSGMGGGPSFKVNDAAFSPVTRQGFLTAAGTNVGLVVYGQGLETTTFFNSKPITLFGNSNLGIYTSGSASDVVLCVGPSMSTQNKTDTNNFMASRVPT